MQMKPLARMKSIAALLFSAMFFLPAVVSASGDGGPALVPAMNDVGNVASLQRGAKYFVNYCMGCHAAKYVRYNRLAEDFGISEDQLVANLMFAADKPVDTMQAAMPADDAQAWFGQAPPDLSLIARSRGTDFIFNFLRGFYIDESRPNGVNNVVLENASMPHVLWELQGLQRRVVEEDDEGHEVVSFKPVIEGSLSAQEYDQLVRDLVNFLDYVGEPAQLQRRELGIWVLLFLLVFGLFAYLLKNEIWKDIK